MEQLGDRVRKAREQAALTQQQLGERAGYAPGLAAQKAISAIENRHPANPRWLHEIARTLGVSVAYLRAGTTGEGGTRYIAQGSEGNTFGKATRPGVQVPEIPVVGDTMAGPDRAFLDLGHPPGWGDQYIPIQTGDPLAYALRVVGDSMHPVISEGRYVITAPSRQPVPDDEVVIRLKEEAGGDTMLKILRAEKDNEVTLDSHNQAYARMVVKKTDIDIMHPVDLIARNHAVKHRLD